LSLWFLDCGSRARRRSGDPASEQRPRADGDRARQRRSGASAAIGRERGDEDGLAQGELEVPVAAEELAPDRDGGFFGEAYLNAITEKIAGVAGRGGAAESGRRAAQKLEPAGVSTAKPEAMCRRAGRAGVRGGRASQRGG
jgi:hypothetical protein